MKIKKTILVCFLELFIYYDNECDDFCVKQSDYENKKWFSACTGKCMKKLHMSVNPGTAMILKMVKITSSKFDTTNFILFSILCGNLKLEVHTWEANRQKMSWISIILSDGGGHCSISNAFEINSFQDNILLPSQKVADCICFAPRRLQ